MKRTIYDKLLKWKNSTRRKPLILQGARQVGKTYILNEFAQREYKKVFYFDFEEKPDLDDIFKKTKTPSKIIKDLSRLQGDEIKPGDHLIIFDEIQASNHALNSLKYFCQSANEYHIASAGSLLGIKLSGDRSFPVGKVNFLNLYPMSFPEFLDAIGKSNLHELIKETTVFKPYAAPFHNELISLLKEYFYTGGMPEVVKHYIESNDLKVVREIQNEIINSFILDFSKHALTSDIPKISLIWDSIPSQLAKENKKFIFSALKKSARSREYENAIQWLSDAGLIMKSYQVKTAKNPLKGFINREIFKVFVLDVGILGAMSDIKPEILVGDNNLFDEYKGAFTENYVAQQLKAINDMDIYYWKSEGHKAEIDFICEHNQSIYPLEAKSGINPKSKSLKSYDTNFSPSHLVRTTLLNLKQDGKICNFPLYAISLFPGLIEKNQGS